MTVERMEDTEPGSETPEAPVATEQPEPDFAADAGGKVSGTADPSSEVALGSSGARPLGNAEGLADRAAAAVDAMTERDSADAAAQNGPSTGAEGTFEEAAAASSDTVATREAAPDPLDDAPVAELAAQPASDQLTQPPSDHGAGSAADAAPMPETKLANGSSPDATDDAPASGLEGTDGPDTIAGEGPDTVAADDTADAPAAAPEEEEAPRDLGPEPTNMEELLREQSGEIRSFKQGDVVEGAVVRIDKDEILVDIGAKSEGVVSNRELYGRHGESQPQLAIGDTVLVYVLQPESNEGHAVLSLRRAGLERKWRAMQEQFEAGVIIEAPVIDHNKGGLIVDCGIRGFVPISQIVDFPRRPQNEQPRDAAQEIAEKLQPFVGRKLRLKILEVNRKANRLILSEKVALYEERREKRDELFSSLTVGQKVTGAVRSIAPFGVFVDLGGIDGLVHKSELSWNKVNNPENGYKVGEQVEAEVIDINHERGRISLSIRRLQPDPWHSTVADLNVNDLIDGTVTKIVNFGAFVRVRDGLEGLIHISELSHQRVAHPADVVHEGQHLKLKIISLDSERHRLGLSLKQAEDPPARPAAPEAPRERRQPRGERSYDMSQAVQEPEGGIDNTLAVAFAQVCQQMEASEQGDEVDGGPAETDTIAEAARAETDQSAAMAAEPAAETMTDAHTVADVLNSAEDVGQQPVAEAADAPALEVSPAPAVAEQPQDATGAASVSETTAEGFEQVAEEPADTSAEAAPDTSPDATPEATPEAAPDTSPDATPEATPEASADTSPDATPEATPEASADTSPEATAEAADPSTVGGSAEPDASLQSDEATASVQPDAVPTDAVQPDEAASETDEAPDPTQPPDPLAS
ncbi:hypothetical protein BH20CHL6_BH20CHL6_17760 [soil metagenome]